MQRKTTLLSISVAIMSTWLTPLAPICAQDLSSPSPVLSWQTASPELPWGSASLFALFVLGDFEQEGADCESGIAVSGNATFSSTMDIGMPYTHTVPQVGYLLYDRSPRFVVNGTLKTTQTPIQVYGGSTILRTTGTTCQVRGYRFDGLYGGMSTYTSLYTVVENTNGNYFAGVDNTTFFADAETALNALSTNYYSKAPESGRIADDGEDLRWQFDIGFDDAQTYYESEGIVYYYVTLPDFCSTLNVRIPDGKKTVVNVVNTTTNSPLYIGPGSVLINDRSGCENGGDYYSFALTNANRVLWNFVAATNLYISSIGFIGSVLAPHATVTALGGSVCGRMVVKNLSAKRGFEVHNSEEPGRGMLRLVKTDAFGNGLPHARFGVFATEAAAQAGVEQNALALLTSGVGGLCESAGLIPGVYYVRETAAPSDYEADPAVYPVTVTDGRSVKVNAGVPLVNHLVGRQGLALSKVCEGGSTNDAFTFQVAINNQPYSGAYHIATAGAETTDGQIVLKGGETARITGLAVGDTYRVEETSDARYLGFSNNTSGIIAADTLAAVAFRNVYKKSITVRKQASAGVTGAYSFSLYDDAACTHLLASVDAVAGGEPVALADVTNGVYYVYETESPQARFVRFTADNQTQWTENPACLVVDGRVSQTLALTAVNSTQLSDIAVQKSGANHVQGTFMFSLYADPELRIWLASCYPSAGAEAVKLATVTNGTYYLYEVLPNRQNQLVSFSDGVNTGTANGFPIIIDGSRATVTVTVTNALAEPETELFLRKSADNGILGDYSFALYATPELNKWAAEATVTAGGETVRLGSVTNGTYYLYEFPNANYPTRISSLTPGVFAPFGSYFAYRVNVTNSPGTLTLSAVNEPLTSIYVQKSTENDVTGDFQMLLYADPACTTWVADCWVTAGQGPVRLATVTNGTYYIHERLNGGIYDFVEFRGATPSSACINSARVDVNGQTNLTLTAINKQKDPLTEIFVQKPLGEGVQGEFTFALFADADLTHKLVQTNVTAGADPVKITSVTNGTYYLHELLDADSTCAFAYAEQTGQETCTVNLIPVTAHNIHASATEAVYVAIYNQLKTTLPQSNSVYVGKSATNGVMGAFTFGLYGDSAATNLLALAQTEAGAPPVLLAAVADGQYYVREELPTNNLYAFDSMVLAISGGGAPLLSSANGMSFSVSGGNTVTVSVANAPKPVATTALRLRKSTANAVSGDFQFNFYADASCALAITSVTAVAGGDWVPLATVTNGTYYLREVLNETGAFTFVSFTNVTAVWTANPAKLVLNNTVGGGGLDLTAVNRRKPPAQHAVYVQKSSINEVSGAFEFALYSDASCAAGSRLGSSIVATAGGSSVLLDTVTNGTYYVREESAQAEYLFVSFNDGQNTVVANPISFTVAGYENTTVNLLAVNCPKPLPKQTITLHKSNANGVTGSFTFALYQDADCRRLAAPPVMVDAGASTDTQLASVTNGVYYLREELPEDSLYQFVSFNNTEGVVNVNPTRITVASLPLRYDAVNIGKALGTITVSKIWSGTTGDSATFHLYRSTTQPSGSNPNGTYVRSVTVSAANSWSAVFTRLELNYYYYVTEDYLEGYRPVYTPPVFLATPTYPTEGQTYASGWVDAAPGRSFGFASDFHVFVFEDFTPKNVGVEGGLAAGGNIALESANAIGLPGMTSQKSYSPQLPIVPHDPRVLCNGTFSSSAMLFIYGGELWTRAYSGKVSTSIKFRSPKDLLPDGTYSGADSKFKETDFEDSFFSGVNSSTLFTNAVTAMKALSDRYTRAQTTSPTGGVLVVAVDAQPVGTFSFEVRPPAGVSIAPYGTIIYNVTLDTNDLATLNNPNIVIPDGWNGQVIINILPPDNTTRMTFNTAKGQGYTYVNGWRTSTGDNNGAQKTAQYEWAARYASRILWNFPKTNLRVIYLNEFAVTGSILAPYAHLEVYAGEVNGQIVARGIGDTGYDGNTYIGPADNANGNSASLWEAHLIRNGVYLPPQVIPLVTPSGRLAVTNSPGVSTPPTLLLQTTTGSTNSAGIGLGWVPTPGRQYKIQVCETLGNTWLTLDPSRYAILYRNNMMEAQILFDPDVHQNFFQVVELQEVAPAKSSRATPQSASLSLGLGSSLLRFPISNP